VQAQQPLTASAQPKPQPRLAAIGLIAMFFTAIAYAQMAKSIPLAGSVFSYVGRGIHPVVGFFAGWAILLDYLLVPTLLYMFAAESMAEESTGKRNAAGKAMVLSLFIVAFCFVLQTWLASALAAGRASFSEGEAGNAFFNLVRSASSNAWATAFLVVNVLAIGIANAMAAQAATSRLLYSMSRDGQLPRFLSKVSSHQVPQGAVLVVSALTAILVLFFVGQIDLISSLVNFGALVGFMLLHISVVVFYIFKKKSKNYLLHLVVPVLGFLIIGYVLLNAAAAPIVSGIVWLVIGACVFAYYRRSGRNASLGV
jgi:amino acid transporter